MDGNHIGRSLAVNVGRGGLAQVKWVKCSRVVLHFSEEYLSKKLVLTTILKVKLGLRALVLLPFYQG